MTVCLKDGASLTRTARGMGISINSRGKCARTSLATSFARRVREHRQQNRGDMYQWVECALNFAEG